jgi:hypothetical protein
VEEEAHLAAALVDVPAFILDDPDLVLPRR